MNNISAIHSTCVGCGACEQICPKGAISFVNNSEGFIYPDVSENCINCGACLNVCPANTKKPLNNENEQSFYGFSANEAYKLESASGGFATYISKFVLKQGGIVCGCALVNNMAKHIFVEREEDLSKLQSSKYVQSDTLGIYSKIKNFLDDGKQVLFIGTPCQIYGLKLYLKIDYTNLLTVDLICHGVPSPLLFKKYIEYLEDKEKSKIEDYNFRYKLKRGWGTYYYYYYCKDTNAKRTGALIFDKYGNDFINSLNYRECCYQCRFAGLDKRPADFTIGDFWGVMNAYPKKFDKYGVSSVVVNSTKGQSFLKDIINESFFIVRKSDILLKQGNLVKPTARPDDREHYYDNIQNDFFKNKKLSVSIRDRIKLLIPQSIVNFLKRL